MSRPTHTINREVVTTQYHFDVDKMSDDPRQFMAETKELFRVMALVVWDDGSDTFKAIRHLYADDAEHDGQTDAKS